MKLLNAIRGGFKRTGGPPLPFVEKFWLLIKGITET